jgi:hypothetical protein
MHISLIFSVIIVFKLISFYVLGCMVVPLIFSVTVIFLSVGSVFVSLIWMYPTINETSRWLLRKKLAIASYDLWIWHAFFGAAGSNNDINMLDQSPLFIEQLQGKAPEVQYIVNGSQYNMGYYLADGIYPE